MPERNSRCEAEPSKPRTLSRAPVNHATGQPAYIEESYPDWQTVLDHSFNLWGRELEFVTVTPSGPDEAAQRADALKVIQEKPFIVIDASNQNKGAPVFESEIARAKIIVNGAGASSLTSEQLAAQAPYRWATQSDSTAAVYLASNFLARSLSGRPAKWAGDPALQKEERAFGLIAPEGVIDVDLFNELTREYGGTLPVETATYDGDAEATQIEELAQTVVAKMKQRGVTSVILFTNNIATAAVTTRLHPSSGRTAPRSRACSCPQPMRIASATSAAPSGPMRPAP